MGVLRAWDPGEAHPRQLPHQVGGLPGERRQAQAAFAREFEAIDRAFSAGHLESPELSAGWGRFKNTLIATADGRYLATARSADAFDRLDGSAQSLDWWANILVAIGLVITFLGITAALAEVAQAVGAQGNAADVQGALVGLLRALRQAVMPEGRIFFGGEPITADFPMPWGLRLDGNSLWAIRKNGWLELGFREDYFARALAETGVVDSAVEAMLAEMLEAEEDEDEAPTP